MELKVGMYVRRKSGCIGAWWRKACQNQGLDPEGTFCIDYIRYGGPVFRCVNDGPWASENFEVVIGPLTKSLEDYL